MPPKQAFPMDFWNGVVHAAEDGEGGAAFSDGADTVYRLQARARAPETLEAQGRLQHSHPS